MRYCLSRMTRRCSHCSQNGHNSRTCPNRGVKLFGVRLTDGLIRKSASMGNLSHYSSSGSGSGSATPQNGLAAHDSPGDTPDHPSAAAASDGYASEDFVAGSSSSRERKKGFFFWQLFSIDFLFYSSFDIRTNLDLWWCRRCNWFLYYNWFVKRTIMLGNFSFCVIEI